MCLVEEVSSGGSRKREMELDTSSGAPVVFSPTDVSDTYRTRMRRKLASGGLPMDSNAPQNVVDFHSLSTSS